MENLEIIADYACDTGECPLWHPDEQKLYWIDIGDGRMFRYDPETGNHEQIFKKNTIGGFTIQEDGSLLLFMSKGAVGILKAGELTAVIDEIPDEIETRFNDVIADPKGRVFCGTMPGPDRPGRLYRLDRDRKLSILLENIGCSNGLGFSPDRKKMYYTDSPKHEIYCFDYDEKNGEISNQKVLITTPEDEGVPDGLTVDAEGCIWSARWDGSCLVRYTPEGKVDKHIPFPVKKVSCVTFGGPDYTDIYVTTAGGRDKENNGKDAGALFHLNLEIKGIPEFRSGILL